MKILGILPFSKLEISRKLEFGKWKYAKVITAAATPQSYKVKKPTSTIRRNRVHLTPLPDQQAWRRNKFQQRLQHLFERTFLFLRETF